MQPGQDMSDRALGLRLAELLVTRFGHDLSGPISGLTAALGEAPADAEALALANEAATTLQRRLRLLRAAWGVPAALSGAALRELAAGLPNAHRLRLHLAGALATAELSPSGGRLLLNALLLAAESLPLGGQVALEGDPARDVVLAIGGPQAAWPPGWAAMLADADAAWSALADARPRQGVQAALTALLAHAMGVRARLLLGGPGEPAAPVVLDLSAAEQG